MYVSGQHACLRACVEVKEQLEGTGPSFPNMGPGNQTQIIRLGRMCHEVTVEGDKNPTLFLFVCL